MEAIQSAAKIMYYGGDLTELLLVIALFIQKAQSHKTQSHKRHGSHKRRELYGGANFGMIANARQSARVQEQTILDG
jgi:hypothetical protein